MQLRSTNYFVIIKGALLIILEDSNDLGEEIHRKGHVLHQIEFMPYAPFLCCLDV